MMSILMMMTGVTIQILLRSEHSVSQQASLELTLLRLSRQFRDDVHAATQYGPKADDQWRHGRHGSFLELSGAHPESHRVEYRLAVDGLTRLTFEGEQDVASERYRLPECEIRFRRETTDGNEAKSEKATRFLTLEIDREGLTTTPQPQSTRFERNAADRVSRKFTVVAELGRDLRMSTLPPAKAETKEAAAESLQKSSVIRDSSGTEATP
jgi:hypothetical protein